MSSRVFLREEASPRGDVLSDGPRAYHLPGIPIATCGEKRCRAKSVASKNVQPEEYKSKTRGTGMGYRIRP
jgi:hypothetical protein